jgi:hypothetical protein
MRKLSFEKACIVAEKLEDEIFMLDLSMAFGRTMVNRIERYKKALEKTGWTATTLADEAERRAFKALKRYTK